MLRDTGRLTCCYVIFAKQAMLKAHAAVCCAKGSMMNWFGEGLEKIKRIYLMGRTGADVWMSVTEEIKYRKQWTRLSLPCEKQGWLSFQSVTCGSGMSQIFLVTFSF